MVLTIYTIHTYIYIYHIDENPHMWVNSPGIHSQFWRPLMAWNPCRDIAWWTASLRLRREALPNMTKICGLQESYYIQNTHTYIYIWCICVYIYIYIWCLSKCILYMYFLVGILYIYIYIIVVDIIMCQESYDPLWPSQNWTPPWGRLLEISFPANHREDPCHVGAGAVLEIWGQWGIPLVI